MDLDWATEEVTLVLPRATRGHHNRHLRLGIQVSCEIVHAQTTQTTDESNGTHRKKQRAVQSAKEIVDEGES